MGTLASKSLYALLVLALLALPLRVLAETVKATELLTNSRFQLVEESTPKQISTNSAQTSEETLVKKTKSSKYRRIYDKQLGRERLIKDGLIVKFAKNTDENQRAEYIRTNNLKSISKIGPNTYLLKVVNHEDIEETIDPNALIRTLNKVHGDVAKYKSRTLVTAENSAIVESVDLNEYKLLSPHVIESPETKRQWHLKNTGLNGLKAGADIKAFEAWDISKGYGVKVAVIDTGFDLKNPDINFYDISYNALEVDEDGNSTSSEDESDAAAPSSSREDHGTAVAGIIAAKDNGKGVVGVAPDAKVIGVRLIDDFGMVSSAQIIAAHRKADELGAEIINNSWGSYDPSLPEGKLLEITEEEREMYEDLAVNGNKGKGILIVFASGNSGDKNLNNSPEARQDCVLAVGATDSTDQRASYSVYGPELDLVAPGGGAQPILTTDRRDQIRRIGDKLKVKVKGYDKGNIAENFHGTSAAAPVVAGVAALVWSVNPKLTASEVRDILEESVDKNINSKYSFGLDSKNEEIGYGRVNAEAAVLAALKTLD